MALRRFSRTLLLTLAAAVLVFGGSASADLITITVNDVDTGGGTTTTDYDSGVPSSGMSGQQTFGQGFTAGMSGAISSIEVFGQLYRPVGSYEDLEFIIYEGPAPGESLTESLGYVVDPVNPSGQSFGDGHIGYGVVSVGTELPGNDPGRDQWIAASVYDRVTGSELSLVEGQTYTVVLRSTAPGGVIRWYNTSEWEASTYAGGTGSLVNDLNFPYPNNAASETYPGTDFHLRTFLDVEVNVPEPGTVALGGVAALALLARRRRRS